MRSNKFVIAACSIIAAGSLGLGASAMASAATSTPTATSSTSTTANPGRGSSDTPVTGAALTKVTAAVKAKDASVTITAVRMDPDGSYDVLGTSGGADVMLQVSKDLATITSGPVGGRGGHGGHGGVDDTPVTGAALTRVTAAVKAKDASVTITAVRMDPDGSYDVLGTKAGADVMLEVSKDLSSITTNTRAGH